VKLNRSETLLVNNPLRAAAQRYYEIPLLTRIAGRVDGGRVLEIGCGNGRGLRLLVERLGAAQVYGIDLDPRQLRRARRRAGCATVLTASAHRLPFPDASFDAVFDFGVLHHVPLWQAAVAEIRRVLQPGGRFYFEEVTRAGLNRWLWRTLLDHPRENRFSEREFLDELTARGITPCDGARRILGGDIFIGAGYAGRCHLDEARGKDV
jgi:ubiquinone/menaquinone biosynthesis C-methylase UbiE